MSLQKRQFFSRLANDIALLKLDEPLEFNKYVQPIRLPKQDEPVGGQVTLSGWGATDEYGYDVSNTLQKVDLPIIGNQRCKYRLTRLTGRLASVVSSNVCTGPLTGGTSACAVRLCLKKKRKNTNKIIYI